MFFMYFFFIFSCIYYFSEVDQFHSILREWTRTCKCMLVFGLSTTGSWYLNPHRLLSAAIVQECNIDIITFNPCALTFIVKALKRIISTAKLAIAPQNVKCIGELANGLCFVFGFFLSFT